MDLATQRRLIHATAAALLALAGGSVVWSLRAVDLPPGSAVDPAGDDGGREITLAAPADGDPPPPNSAVDWNLALQEPLYRPPPPPAPTPKPQAAPVVAAKPPKRKVSKLDWSLAGTIIQSPRSVAILTDASGKTDVRGTGEIVELDPPGVLVRRIDADAVTLEVDGASTTLQLRRNYGGASDASAGGREDRATRRRNR